MVLTLKGEGRDRTHIIMGICGFLVTGHTMCAKCGVRESVYRVSSVGGIFPHVYLEKKTPCIFLVENKQKPIPVKHKSLWGFF